MKIVVLAGGLSPERDVSLTSGSLVANALLRSGNEVLLIDVYEGCDEGIEFKSGTDFQYEYVVTHTEPDLNGIKKRNNNQVSLIGRNVLEICGKADKVFLGLHGDIGENGQLQAVLDTYGIKYTGSGYIGCLLAMDKDITKRLLKQASVPTADWLTVDLSRQTIDDFAERITYPCVVKPCSCGSSVGVSIVDSYDGLRRATEAAKKYETKLLIEKKINGREFSVGILDNKALPVIEIIPKSGFYDYVNKYQAGFTTEITPAELSLELTGRVQDWALKVHETLCLGYYSRIDFILDESRNEFMCLEANTLPGMTPTSLLPQEALAAGISYDELCMLICSN